MSIPYIDTGHWPPRNELVERHARGQTWQAIADSLGVSRSKLQSYLDRKDDNGNERDPRLAIMASDRAFQERMRAAIASKKERATYGVCTESGATMTRLSLPGLTHSGCGSPAAACCEW